MASPEEIVQKYLSPRAQELGRLGSYVTGTQYDGRPDWFDNSSEVPLFDRKPCIKYPIVKSAIGSHVSFVLGEGRWPAVSSATSEDDIAIDEDWGLDQDDSEALGRFVNVVLVRYARLKQVAREMLGDAMGSRAVAVVCSVKMGRLMAETVRAEWCTPVLNEIDECSSIEIRYPFIESYYNDQRRQWERRCMLYRRVIDGVQDTVYQPAQGLDDGREPEWIVDTTKTKAHGLGFCPVIWYPFMKPCSTGNTVDGVAIHEHQLTEIDCLNVALSQKQRAAVTAGDPQLYETGVPEDEKPGQAGVPSRAGIMQTAGKDGKAGAFIFASRPTGGRSMVRKRGAGVIWTYRSPEVKVNYLTIPGDALKAIDDHARDLRGKIAESLQAIFIDPAEMKTHAAMSGKALSYVFGRQLAYDDQIRDDFAEKGLLPLVSMLLRIVYVVGSKNKKRPGLYMPGVAKILPILSKFERDIANDNDETTGTTWLPPRLEPVWGPYFAPNEADQLAIVTLVVAALQAGTITKQMAVEKLASSGVFEVGSAAEVVDAIEKEAQKAQETLHKAMHALGAKPNGGSGRPGGGQPAGAGADSEGDSGDSSSAAAA